jgi:hypothetical protein
MTPCAYCDRPLTCDACQTEYVPPSLEHYEALSRPEVALICPECGAGLVCRWCKTPYDGVPDDHPAGTGAAEGG